MGLVVVTMLVVVSVLVAVGDGDRDRDGNGDPDMWGYGGPHTAVAATDTASGGRLSGPVENGAITVLTWRGVVVVLPESPTA
jgi:hypothetical protein